MLPPLGPKRLLYCLGIKLWRWRCWIVGTPQTRPKLTMCGYLFGGAHV
eukprot:COSAG03_NODE_4291_length_1605_cov_1.045153_1_plen_47_part_10